MAGTTAARPPITLRRAPGTYVTRENRRNHPDGLVRRTYDPVARRHVDFREDR